jgi:acetyl-CoA synthetase
MTISLSELSECGMTEEEAKQLATYIQALKESSPEKIWQTLSKKIDSLSFQTQLCLFKKVFPHWPADLIAGPAWIPSEEVIQSTHIAHSMKKLKFNSYKEFYTWSIEHYDLFWEHAIRELGIIFKTPYEAICDLTKGVESPIWLKGAKLNIIDSCFSAPPSKTAIVFQNGNTLQEISYNELNQLSNQIANSLIKLGCIPGDAIAIDMPMTYQAVAIYIGIIKMGGVVVSIADSFSPEEIAIRLTISKTKAIFTQDKIIRGEKLLPLYDKVIAANAPPAIVITIDTQTNLRLEDVNWDTFLIKNTDFTTYAADPMTNCNILFSSGTTGEPKAIPWKHSTAIKTATDAHFHQNIHSEDVLAWPTNLGWMMGPWLIFAGLMNQATIALYDGLPRERAFGEFIQNAKVTMLGIVPTLVASWRQSGCMEGLNWQTINTFSSTGECSNPEDMLYLMSLAGYKPVIEYCGGTEIGGAYITSTLVEKNYPSVCTTPTLGTQFVLLNEQGNPAKNGEVALLPPILGMSTELLNANHHTIYYQDMPQPDGKILRRHGDQICELANGYYSVLGRADDTMNLGGIKISSAEIERVLVGTTGILETAAVATLGGGPSQLIIFAATQQKLDKEDVKKEMQNKINQRLNPLFKIMDVELVSELPKTASNKIMRRLLRKSKNPC